MIRKRLQFSGAFSLALFLILCGCVSIKSTRTDDPHVITHHTWWNHYERGRLYLREGNFAAARADFEIALGRIPGARYPYAQDRWRVRTYGMHMLEGYFPHRELAICLYNLNAPEAALQLLETSMEMEPSARAKFYINRIHRQLAQAAAPPPVIDVSPLPGWTKQRSVVLEGTASGSNEVERIAINGEAERIELARHQIHFRKEVSLQEGRNRIAITAEDLDGKQASTNVLLTADWTPPQIALHRKGTNLTIECRDNLGLQQVRINGKKLPASGTAYALDWPILSDETIQLTAFDQADNSTAWTLSEKELAHMAESTEPAPPRLDLYNAGATVTVFNPEFDLDLRAEDDTALRTVELNGTNLLASATPLFRALRRIPLTLGTNQISIALADFDGNRTEAGLTVIYRKPAYLDSIYRLAAMLSPLSGEAPSPAFAQRINGLMENELTTPPVRFYLVAAEGELQALQNEQQLSESEYADPRTKLDPESRLASDLVFNTRMLSDAPGQTVYTRVLDARSNKELFVEDVYVEDPAEWPDQLHGLVMKIEQRFPLVQGCIQERDGSLAIDAGETSGTQEGLRMLVIRSDGPFNEGRVVQAGNRPLEVVVSEVEPEASRIIIPRGQPKDSVHPGDYVFSR